MTLTKPHLVFVSGAWHVPAHFEPLTSKLSALGYTCHVKQMPAVGSSNPPKDLSEDIAFVRAAVEAAIGDDENDVVVICHSWGGIITGSSLTDLGKAARNQKGKKHGVLRTGYIAAFMVPEQTCLAETSGENNWTKAEPPYIYALDPNIFYNDLPEAEQKHWFSLVQSHTLATFLDTTPAASWKEIPTSYLLCEDDLAIPVAVQEAMTNQVRELGGEIEVTRFKCGHSPFLSKIPETVEWVEGVVRKGMEEGAVAEP